MSVNAPKIDTRDADKIAEQVVELLKYYAPDWKEFDVDTGKPEGVSSALIHIFARFSEILIQRLNKAPEKNFMAFLDMLGASLLPPQPARVPLTFSLSAGSADVGRAPAGTQVAAPPAEGEKDPVIFETERELVVTAVALKSVWVREPDQDAYAEKSHIASLQSSTVVPVFEGVEHVEHILYLGHDILLDYPSFKELKLSIRLTESIAEPDPRRVQWEIWDGEEGIKIRPSDTTMNLTRSGEVTFTDLSSLFPQLTLYGQKSRWLRCRLMTPITRSTAPTAGMVRVEQLPSIDSIKMAAVIEREELSAETAFANHLQLDLSKPFFPFGEKPENGDTLYLANSEAFCKAGATVTLAVGLQQPGVASDDLELIWEFGNGKKWTELAIEKDSSASLTKNGAVQFTFPNKVIFPTVVNGVIEYWVRVRISAGNYGKEAGYNPVETLQLLFNLSPDHQTALNAGEVSSALSKEFNEKKGVSLIAVVVRSSGKNWLLIDTNNKIYDVKKEGMLLNVYIQSAGYNPTPATFVPPIISKIAITYSLQKSDVPDTILTYNDFSSEKVVSDNRFRPFTPVTDEKPTLYLGFTPPPGKTFPNNKITLYFGCAPVFFGDSADNPSPLIPPQLTWQYWGSHTWSKLTVRDETEAFTRSGLVEFIAPVDFASHNEFAEKDRKYWLKVCLESGEYEFKPRLNHLLLNTTLASQSVTIRDETLGSSDGSEAQQFKTRRAPVLSGQKLEVREPESPSAGEQLLIMNEEGDDAVSTTDNKGRKEIWVRWHEMPDFYGSGPRDRHYVLNHLTGNILFGDGINGLIPPVGNGNLRISVYRSGGGASGNRAENTIVQLKTTVPYVEKVTNVETSAGGADAETIESLIDRAPRTIRHRGRAVTLEDYEDMAMLASPEVARAKCVPLCNLQVDSLSVKTALAGDVSVVVVPHSTVGKPLPSLELINRVQEYLRTNGLPTVNVSVVGPLYVGVEVRVEISLSSMEGASVVEQAVYHKLADFLHPLTGGSEKRGWAFGRKPHKSDFYALIESVRGVDHIRSLSVTESEDLAGAMATGRFLVYSGGHTVLLHF
ncbi:MAG: putative baseplate assembly protein [Proteobacteria bacterium]|nr:putative baseplate assembly protein [Pseudomonadota bacterium]